MKQLIKYAFFVGSISISGILISIPILIFEKYFPECFYTCFLSAVILLYMFENWNILEDLHKEVALREQVEAMSASQGNVISRTQSELKNINLVWAKLNTKYILLKNANAKLSLNDSAMQKQLCNISASNSGLIIQNSYLLMKIKKMNTILQNSKLELIREVSCGSLQQLSF